MVKKRPRFRGRFFIAFSIQMKVFLQKEIYNE